MATDWQDQPRRGAAAILTGRRNDNIRVAPRVNERVTLDWLGSREGALDRVEPRTSRDEGTIEASFNIMPDRNVREQFAIREVIVDGDEASAIFDRSYSSDMRNSPNHITMIVLPLLTQRLFYAWCCNRLDLPYDPDAPELFKIWPTKLEFRYTTLVRTEKMVRYDMKINEFRATDDRHWFFKGESNIDQKLFVDAEGIVKF